MSKFFGVSGTHLDRAVQTARGGFVGTPTLRAGERYTGVVWEYLGLASLSAPDRRWAANHVAVVSGLLGLALVGDAVPDYRLKMGARLPVIGNLAKWWKPKLEFALREVAHRSEVIDLLPKEHAAACDPAVAARRTTRVEFMSADGAHAAGHAAKMAKGLTARVLIERRTHTTEVICKSAAIPGYVFDTVRDVNERDNATVIALRAKVAPVCKVREEG